MAYSQEIKNSSTYTNESVNTTTYTQETIEDTVGTIYAGSPIGLLLSLTYAVNVSVERYTREAKNEA